jgi:GT2 family glycosyltransferase
LVFVDADTQVTGAVIGAAVHAMRAGAVGGGSRARFDGRVPLYGRIMGWIWLEIIQRFGHVASGCFLFCTRRSFAAVGGFDQTLYAAEDVVLSRRLKDLGRFVILQESVVTSGRNIRSHSALELLRIVVGFALHGPSFFRARHGPWYGQRRDDPELGVRKQRNGKPA